MTIRWFAGVSTGALVIDPTTGTPIGDDTGTAWDSATSGTQYEHLLNDDEVDIGSTLYADDYGYVQQFGIDAEEPVESVWLDFTGGRGPRVRIECNDRATFRADQSDVDDALAAKMNKSDAGVSVAQLDGNGNVLEQGEPLEDRYLTEVEIQNLTDMQNQLMDVAATTEELSQSVRQEGAWDGVTTLEANLSDDYTLTIWTAPFTCEVRSLDLVREFGSTDADNTNYITLTLEKRAPDGTSSTIAIKDTTFSDGEAMDARVPWSFDGAEWNTTAATLAKGDTLRISYSFSGSATMRFPASYTFRYTPT